MTCDWKQVASCSYEIKDFDVVCLKVTAVTAYGSEEDCQPIITEYRTKRGRKHCFWCKNLKCTSDEPLRMKAAFNQSPAHSITTA